MNAAVARQRHDDPLYHPIAKVQPLVDMAHNNFRNRYSHHREISIDEAMKGFKGRTELQMYMPNKPTKFGIKFWARCDGKTAFLSDFQLYSGKRDSNDLQKEHGLGYRVVHDLSRDLIGLNHVLYFDRFFTGISLLNNLVHQNIFACATIMPNRKGTPEELRCGKRQLRRKLPQRGDSISYQNDAVTLTAWNDNNVVVIAHTNLPNPAEATTCERRVKNQKIDVNQPEAINNYNQHMNGVDIHDQLRGSYPAGRASKKYWKYIMWFVVDCCQVNSWIVYKECTSDNKELTHKQYVLAIGRALVGDYTSRKCVTIAERTLSVSATPHKVPHVYERLPGKKLRCKGCYQRKRRLDTVYGCATCNKHLCNDCFKASHM